MPYGRTMQISSPAENPPASTAYPFSGVKAVSAPLTRILIFPEVQPGMRILTFRFQSERNCREKVPSSVSQSLTFAPAAFSCSSEGM